MEDPVIMNTGYRSLTAKDVETDKLVCDDFRSR